jgi:subtilase-type serine protease
VVLVNRFGYFLPHKFKRLKVRWLMDVMRRLWIRGVAVLGLLLLTARGGSSSAPNVPAIDVPPIDMSWIESDDLVDYLDTAKAAWRENGKDGLSAVLAAVGAAGYDFEAIKQDLLDHEEYKNVNPHRVGPSLTGPDRKPVDTSRVHPFTLGNIQVALAAGLTGKDQLIAIHDRGFEIDHPDLVSKNIQCFTPIDGILDTEDCAAIIPRGDEDHGTKVSIIAAGSAVDGGVMGVAPDADLLVLDYSGENIDWFDRWDRQVQKARELNAVVLNGSWGYYNFNQEFMDNMPRVADFLDAYQDVGVVVFAKSNFSDEWTLPGNPANGDYPPDLPYYHDELQEAWISAINAQFHADPADGMLQRVIRKSSACGLSAAWCLVGSGDMVVGNSSGKYQWGTGTSFVAPQISGAVALMAEAFPSLAPADWTARLLASANNDWFANPGSTVVNKTGHMIYDASLLDERCWNNNTVCHTYSEEWGHGFMNMEAALSPIGGLSLLSGANVLTAQSHSLRDVRLSAPASRIYALKNALDFSLTVFDGLNGNFRMDAASLASPVSRNTSAMRLLDHVSVNGAQDEMVVTAGNLSFQASNELSRAGLPASLAMQSGKFGEGLVTQFGFSSEDQVSGFGGLSQGAGLNSIGFSGLMGNTTYAGLGSGDGEQKHLMLFGFTGENRNTDDALISGVGARFGLDLAGSTLEFSATQALEEGSSLGLSGHQDIWFGGDSTISAAQLAVSHEWTGGYRFTGRIELGAADQDTTGALVRSADRSWYSGFEARMEKNGVWSDTDGLALWVSQPLRVEQSNAVLSLPSGRTRDGDIIYQDQPFGLVPSGRQIDLGLNYNLMAPDKSATLQLGVAHSFNEGHRTNQQATAIAARYGLSF